MLKGVPPSNKFSVIVISRLFVSSHYIQTYHEMPLRSASSASIKSPFHIIVGTPHQPYTLSNNATQRPTSGAIHKHKLLFKRVTLYCIYITAVLYGCNSYCIYAYYTKNIRTYYTLSLSYNTIIAAKLQKNVIGECSHIYTRECNV